MKHNIRGYGLIFNDLKDIVMIEYKYKKKENKFTENGHTMFEVDVLQRLKRLAALEEQIKQVKKLTIPVVVKSLTSAQTTKNATVKIALSSNTGYKSNEYHKISPDQWFRIQNILNEIDS